VRLITKALALNRIDSMSKKNRHGLKRYIPASIKRTIRKNSGYGCVVCGNAIVDYEHVDPEWNDAKSHNASKMTLLCPSCHAKVTRGTLSKARIKECMKDPWTFKNGLSYDGLELPATDPKIFIGNSIYQTQTVVLRAYGKNLLQFHPPETANSPYRVSGEFYNQAGALISRIKKNIFESVLGEHDVQFVGTKITVKSPGQQKPSLVLERSGGEDLRIEELNMFYRGISFNVSKEGVLTVLAGRSTFVIDQSQFNAKGVIFNFS